MLDIAFIVGLSCTKIGEYFYVGDVDRIKMNVHVRGTNDFNYFCFADFFGCNGIVFHGLK